MGDRVEDSGFLGSGKGDLSDELPIQCAVGQEHVAERRAQHGFYFAVLYGKARRFVGTDNGQAQTL